MATDIKHNQSGHAQRHWANLSEQFQGHSEKIEFRCEINDTITVEFYTSRFADSASV